MAFEFEQDARKIAEENGIDPEVFLKLLDQESKGRVHARSSKGAMGLGQLMPGTAREMGVTNPHDPIQNMTGSAKYLKKMLGMFNGDMRQALAAYNAGPGNVKKYGGIPPFPETQKYVDALSPEVAAASPSPQMAPAPPPGDGSLTGMMQSGINQLVASQYGGSGNGLSAMPFGLGGGQQTEEMPGEPEFEGQAPQEEAPEDYSQVHPYEQAAEAEFRGGGADPHAGSYGDYQPETLTVMPNDRQLEQEGLLSRMGRDPREEPGLKSKIFQAGLPALAAVLGGAFGSHGHRGTKGALQGLATGFAGDRLDAATTRHKLQYEQQAGLLQAAKENFKALSGLNLDQLKDHAPHGALQSIQGAWDKFHQALSDDKITPKEAKELNEAWGTVSGLMSGLKATQGTLEADQSKGLGQSLQDARTIEDIKPALASQYQDEQDAAGRSREADVDPITADNPDEVMAAPPVQDMDKLLGEAAKRRISQKKLQEATGVPMKDYQGNTFYGKPSDVNAAGRLELERTKATTAAKVAMARVAATDKKTDAYLKSIDQRKRDSIMRETVKNIISLGMDPIEAFNASMDAIQATQGLNGGGGGSDQMNPPPSGSTGTVPYYLQRPEENGTSEGKVDEFTFRKKQ